MFFFCIVCVCQVILKIAVIVVVNKKRSFTNEELVEAVRTLQIVQHYITCIHDIRNKCKKQR